MLKQYYAGLFAMAALLNACGASGSVGDIEDEVPGTVREGPCAPATCPLLGVECGEPSDGCGGSLDCGLCADGETCANGLCVDVSTPSPPPNDGSPERPWAHNTGPSNPGILSRIGSTDITVDGTVLENVELTGKLDIHANNVVVRNFRIKGTSQYGVQVRPGYTNIVLEDGEVTSDDLGDPIGTGVYCQSGCTLRRIHIHDTGSDGMKIMPSGGAQSIIEYNFIEKLGRRDGAHADGNQSSAGGNIIFRYNNFYMPYPGTPDYPGTPYKSNATFIIKDTTFAPYIIENNWLTGGNYTIYCGTNVIVRNNIFGRQNRGWPNHPESNIRAKQCAQWSGNVWEDDGSLLK